MACTAYSHLNVESSRIFIALYTAFLIHLDDMVEPEISHLYSFNKYFVHKEPHGTRILEAFALLLRETTDHFDDICSNIIVTATLNLVTARLLEENPNRIQLPVDSLYPLFSRTMSGAAEAYALFAFHSNVPWTDYIHAIPDIANFINDGNDVLSFYKENLAGDEQNRISMISKCKGVSKIDALTELASEGTMADGRVLRYLKTQPDALRAYQEFRVGYIHFHLSLPRYKL
ncbi:terpenoid synthase, partial [Gymnopus androsaceus JB14]